MLGNSVMEMLYCFKHCSEVSSIFYDKSKFPDHCPLCELPLKDNISFVLEPFCVPNPFWNGDCITTTALLLKLSISDKRLVKYIGTPQSNILKCLYWRCSTAYIVLYAGTSYSIIFSHHIGVVTPSDQVVHHYDASGIMCDHLTTNGSWWMGTVMVPIYSPTHQRSCDQVIANLALQDDWSAERCAYIISYSHSLHPLAQV